MFKVSLLPEGYRKQLIGKKNKDIILTVAVVILLCMLIVYAGIAIRFLILKGQEKSIKKRNAQIVEKINELSPYVNDYNALAVAEANYANIKPVDITALEMVNIIQGITPDYIEITALYAPDWQKNQVCVIEGKLSAANTLSSAVSMLNEYKKVIGENAELKGSIKEVKVVNDEPIVETDSIANTRTYAFRIIVSLSGAITIDQQTGTLVTTTKPETTAPAPSETSTNAQTNEDSTVEPSTIGANGETKPSETVSESKPASTSNGGNENE